MAIVPHHFVTNISSVPLLAMSMTLENDMTGIGHLRNFDDHLHPL